MTLPTVTKGGGYHDQYLPIQYPPYPYYSNPNISLQHLPRHVQNERTITPTFENRNPPRLVVCIWRSDYRAGAKRCPSSVLWLPELFGALCGRGWACGPEWEYIWDSQRQRGRVGRGETDQNPE